MAITAAQLNVRFASEGVAGVKGDIQSVGAAVDQSAAKSKMLGAGFLGVGAAIAGGFGFGISAAINFEQAIANVAAVAGATGAQMTALSDKALQIGADTAFSATEGALAIEELLKAGVGIEDVMNGAADGAAALAAASGIELPAAATAMANALNIFSLSGDQATRVANVFAAAANKSSTDVHQLQMGLAQGGAQFAMYGMTVEESVGALAMFSDYGLKGSDSATSLNAALRSMATGTGASGDAMAALGISMYDSNGQFVGLDGVAAQLQATLGHLTEEERNLYLTQLGGADGMRALNILYEEGVTGVNEYTDAVTGTDAASEAAAVRMDTVKGAIEALMGSVETLAITFMSGMLPAIKAITKGLTGAVNFLTKLPKSVQTAIVGFTALAGILATVAGAFILFGPQIAAIGAIVAGIMSPMLALAAVAGLVYVAWRTNFMDLRNVVQGALKPITGFINRFKKAWAGLAGTSDVMSQILDIGGQAGAIVAPINSVSRALSAMATAIRGIGGDNTPAWLVGLAEGFDRAAEFVSGFKREWDNLGVSSVMDQINQWGGITSSSMGIGERALRSFSMGLKMINGDDTPAWLVQLAFGFDRLADSLQAGGLSGFVSQLGTELRNLIEAIPVQDILVDIAVGVGNWVIDGLAGLWDEIARKITGTPQGEPVSIGDVLVAVAWKIVETAGGIWEKIETLIMGGGADAGMSGDGTGGATPRQDYSIGDVLIKVGWKIVEAAGGIWEKIETLVMGGGADAGMSGDGTGGARPRQDFSIGEVAVTIADWVVDQAVNLGQRVFSWIQGTAIPAITRAAFDLGTFAVKVANWTVDQAVNLGQRVFSWIQGTAIPAITKAAFDLGTFAVTIADWVVDQAVMIGERVWSWITAAASSISRVPFDIGSFYIKISEWLKSGWEDLFPWVQRQVSLSWIGNEGAPFGLGVVSVKVADFDVKVDTGKLYDDIDAAFREQTAATPERTVAAEEAGKSHGETIRDGFVSAFETAFTDGGGGGGDGTGGGGGAGIGAMTARLGAYLTNFSDGLFGEGFWTAPIPIPAPNFDWGFWTKPIPMPVIDWPDMPGINDIPFATDFVQLLGNIAELFRGIDWSFDIGIPDITWPTLPGINDIPFVTGFIELLGNIADLFRDIDWSFDIGLPDITWPKVGDLIPKDIKDFLSDPWGYAQSQFGGELPTEPVIDPNSTDPTLRPGEDEKYGSLGRQIASIDASGAIAQLDALDRKIVTVAERFAGLAGDGLDALKITADNTQALAGIQTVKDSISGLAGDGLDALKITADNTDALTKTQATKDAITGISISGIAATKITADNTDAMTKIQATKDAIAGLGGGGDGLDVLKSAAQTRITADNTDALAKIQAVKDAIAGLGGDGLDALKAGAQGGGAVITVDTSAAMRAIGDVSAGLAGLAIMAAAVVITGDNAAAMQAIGDVSAGMAGIDGMSSMVALLGDNGAAMKSIGDVSAGMFGIDGMTSTIYIKGDKSHAMSAINAVAAYDGRSLGTATFTVKTITTRSPARVGAGMGRGLLSGWDRATGTRSPSTEMIKRGQYLYKGLDLGWTGSASNLPIGFDVASPASSLAGAITSAGATNGGGNITGALGSGGAARPSPTSNVTVHVHIAGNVTAEDDLARAIIKAVDTGYAENLRQRQRAMGAV